MKDKSSALTTVFLVMISCFYILIGVFMLFIPNIKHIYLTYVICGMLILFGIILIVRYFVKEAYRRIHEYGFAIGTLMVIGGSCGLARSQQLTGSLQVFLGICLLVTSVVMLQNMIQLKTLKSKLWILTLIVSVLSTVCSVIIIVNLFEITDKWKNFTFGVLLADGIISLISLMLVELQVRHVNKMEDKTKDKAEENQPDVNGESNTSSETAKEEEMIKQQETEKE